MKKGDFCSFSTCDDAWMTEGVKGCHLDFHNMSPWPYPYPHHALFLTQAGCSTGNSTSGARSSDHGPVIFFGCGTPLFL